MRTKIQAIFFLRHKCASMWLSAIAERACAMLGIPYVYFYKSTRWGWNFADFYQKTDHPVLGCANPEIDEVRQLQNFRGVHVVRDPRDLIVSAYFSHRYSHWFKPGTEEYAHQERLRRVPKEEGIRLEIEFSERYLRPIADWDFSMPHVLELKFEEVTARPYESILQIFAFLGLLDEDDWTWWRQLIDTPRFVWNRVARRWGGWGRWPRRTIPAEKLLGIVYELQFERLARRSRGQEDPKSHYRKGQPGDWRNHFTEEHVALFKERYPGLLVKLGYEPDDNWSLTARAVPSECTG
ncbi:sulfotransferase domain-containing protein [Rhodothermus profundi]|uniref:Sulfotransferase domain-containing protein n=1 Tax=Rhodothermus profundi TaxID=633813 RepID=A0A1M6XI81_9BACT|nr:sulfotransferase domain-containing protein [Rhodothermus profundi]SHL05651.1 Sulfotransferase domain-containing protein [Rhodothermus profundi]